MTRPAIPTATSASSTPASRLPYFSRSSGIVVVTGSSTGYGSMPSSIIFWRLASRMLIWPGRSSFCGAAAGVSLVVTDNRLQREARPRGFGFVPVLAAWRAPGVECTRIRPFGPPSAPGRARLQTSPKRPSDEERGEAATRPASSCVADATRDSDVHRETSESRMRRR